MVEKVVWMKRKSTKDKQQPWSKAEAEAWMSGLGKRAAAAIRTAGGSKEDAYKLVRQYCEAEPENFARFKDAIMDKCAENAVDEMIREAGTAKTFGFSIRDKKC